MLLFATMLTFTACGGDDERGQHKVIQRTAYSMYHEDTQTIEGTNVADLVWESDNEFVATVKTAQLQGSTLARPL